MYIVHHTWKLHMPFWQFFSFDFGLIFAILRRFLPFCVVLDHSTRRQPVVRMPTFFLAMMYILWPLAKYQFQRETAKPANCVWCRKFEVDNKDVLEIYDLINGNGPDWRKPLKYQIIKKTKYIPF